VEIKQPVSTSEQNRLVDDWYGRRPVKPGAAETLRRETSKPARSIFPVGLLSFIFAKWPGHSNTTVMEESYPEYEQAMTAWRLEVRRFYKWWPTNEHVSEVLKKSAKDTYVL